MSKRHEAIGIKQVIRLEWMEKAASLLLAGMDGKSIRSELHEFLADRRGSGKTGERSTGTRTFAVNNLMRTWIEPDTELRPFRDAALVRLGADPGTNLAVHWAMISAAYPFWFSVARQAGRLLNLQESVTQQQITGRLKEAYGDRPTTSRYTRFVLRSFVAWGVLKEADAKGAYIRSVQVELDNAAFLIVLEGAVHTKATGKLEWNALVHDPALFPFSCSPNPRLLSDSLPSRLEVESYGSGEQYVALSRQ